MLENFRANVFKCPWELTLGSPLEFRKPCKEMTSIARGIGPFKFLDLSRFVYNFENF